MFEMIQQTDFMILDWIQENLRCGWLDRLMPGITLLGEVGILWIIIAVLLLLNKKKRRIGLMIAVGLVGCLVFGLVILKNAVARPRPCWINTEIDMLIGIPKDYSFPSGHTMSSISSALILLWDEWRTGIPAMIMAILIAFSRMYLYVHFPTDILGGALTGILMAFLAKKLLDRFLPVKAAVPESGITAANGAGRSIAEEKTTEESIEEENITEEMTAGESTSGKTARKK